MKGRPRRDGDLRTSKLPATGLKRLDEGPSPKGRRPPPGRREDGFDRDASMKGRPRRDGDLTKRIPDWYTFSKPR